MSVMSPVEDTQADAPFPAFVEKAREDAHWRAALERAGYARIRPALAQQLRDDPEASTFRGLEGTGIPPPISLVREWLHAKSKRQARRLQQTFLGAMLATIAAVLAFAAVFTLLGRP